MSIKRLAGVAMVATALMAPTLAQAQVTQYGSLAAYLAAVSSPGTDTYTGFSISGTTPSPINRTAGAYSYSASAAGGFFGAGTVGNPWLSTNNAVDPMVFSGFSSSVRGIGGNFFGSNINGGFQAGDIRIDWTEVGGASGFTILLNATTNSFFGVVSAGGGFTSFTVTSVQPAGAFLWGTVDNFVLGAAPTTTAPEPQTYALVAAGLLAMGVVARRRRIA
jgi:hypothetical protein